MIPYGCAALALGALTFSVYVVVAVPSARLVVIAVALGILLARLVAWWQLRQALTHFRRTHVAFGRDLLIVYSASPHWQEYIDSHWLTKWRDRAVTLNRSAPDWQQQPEAVLWRRLAGRTEHTPVAIVVPLRDRPRIIRFYTAFRDYKHGKATTLHEREADLEHALSDSKPATSSAR